MTPSREQKVPAPTPVVSYYTSNAGKVAHMQRLVSMSAGGVRIAQMAPKMTRDESDSTAANARGKALDGSQFTGRPVLASDEALQINGIDPVNQPGPRVRRVLGVGASDETLIRYYAGLIARLGQDRSEAVVSASYAIARNATLLGEVTVDYTFELRLPAARSRLSGRPLAALHFVPEYGKHYSELLPREIVPAERRIGELLIQFLKMHALCL